MGADQDQRIRAHIANVMDIDGDSFGVHQLLELCPYGPIAEL